MKKFSRYILIIVLILALAITLMACDKKDENGLIILKTPKVELSGNNMSWGAIKKATSYGVTVDSDEEIITDSTSFVLKYSRKTVTAKVRAIGDGVKYTNSAYSDTVSFTRADILDIPKELVLNKLEDKSVKLTWGAVANAKSYECYLHKSGSVIEMFSTTDLAYLFEASNFADPAIYEFTVKAIAGDSGFIDSAESVKVHHYVTEILKTPENAIYSTSGTLSWKAVANATKYDIRLTTNINGEITETFKTTTTNLSFDSSKLTIETAGVYKIEIKAYKPGSMIFLDSPWVGFVFTEQDGKIAEITKHAAPTNICVESDMLKWNAVEGIGELTYSVKFTSGEKVLYNHGVKELELDLSKVSDITTSDLNDGKLFKVEIYVGSNKDKSVIDGLFGTLSEKYQHIVAPTANDEEIFEIKTLAHLAYISKNRNGKYKLMVDIDAKKSEFKIPSTVDGSAVAEFKGSFDGNNKTISNMNILDSKSLFGDIAVEGVVKNLGLLNVTISESHNVALVANVNKGTISNIVASGKVESIYAKEMTANTLTGGIAVENSGTISGVSVDVDVVGINTVGGIVAINTGTIFNCNVYSEDISALAVAKADEIKGVSKASTTVLTVNVGGIAGINNKVIKFSFVKNVTIKGTVAGANSFVYVGGIAGSSTGIANEIFNCYVSTAKSIKASSSGDSNYACAGGLVGIADGSIIKDSYVHSATISGLSVGAGVIGKATGCQITNVYCTATRITLNNKRGSFVGENVKQSQGAEADNSFTNCHFGNYYQEGIVNEVITGVTATPLNEMINVNFGESFVVNKDINSDFPVLKSMLYMEDSNFSDGVCYTTGDRTYSTIRFNSGNEIKVATISANISNTGLAYDTYKQNVTIDGKEVEVILHKILTVKIK